MAGIFMLLVTVSAFITVESRAVMNQQLATRAKLNAIVSMRLALAHLQQEAGPDRRSTARADITQPEVVFAYKLRNPMWTGIWRTDLPDLPPAWLISGRADQPTGTQSISLYDDRVRTNPLHVADYHAGYWAPWQTSYSPGATTMVNLVGTGSASGADGSRPSGLVTLPKIELPTEPPPPPDKISTANLYDRIKGNYAYWIGDEGIKARVNLREKRAQTDTSSVDQMISLRSPLTHGLLKNLPDQAQLDTLSSLRDVKLLTDLDKVVGGGAPVEVRNYFHDISLSSAGVLADSLNGGLKRDLSVAFELSDAQFAATEFGRGVAGANPAAGTMTENGFAPTTMDVLRVFNPDKSETTLAATPIFSRTVPDGQVRGPTWWALRDYHRLYKQLGWSGSALGTRATSTPSLRARALWPNADAARPTYVDKDQTPALPGSGNPDANKVRRSYYSYSDVYNGDLPPSVNPNANDQIVGQSDKLVIRPLRTAASPYVQRISLAFSVNKMQWFVLKSIRIGKNVIFYYEEWIDIRVNVTPIVVLHNPYNVKMVLAPNPIAGPDKTRWQKNPNNGLDSATGTAFKQPYSIAISFADLKDWKFRFKQYFPDSTAIAFEGDSPLSDFFRIQSGTPIRDAFGEMTGKFLPPYESDDEDSFRLYLTKDNDATITLEPGEMRVFSCAPLIGDWSKSVLLDNTFDMRGGFRDNVYDWNFGDDALASLDITAPISFEIIPGGNMRMRTAIAGSPNDQLYRDRKIGKSQTEIDGDKEDFLRLTSELNEVVFTDINESKYARPGEKFFSSWRQVRDKYPRKPSDPYWDGRKPFPINSLPYEADLVTVIDIAAKTADTPATEAPFPLFTHSNPLAPTQRASSSGRTDNGPDKGADGASPSYQLAIRNGTWLSTKFADGTYAGPVVSATNSGRVAFGGNSAGPTGTQKAILTEVPLFQPISLAQYAHANFGVRDQQPLLSIGNSFASPLIDATKKPFQDNGASWTDFDQSYLLNAALWDGFFLSSVAPQMKTDVTTDAAGTAPTPPDLSSTATITADPNEKTGFSLTDVIKRFVEDGVPLDNPRFSTEHSKLDAAGTAKALADYRRSASVLTNNGAFNVNSTSVTAWQAFLGSAKNLAIADKAANFPEADQNTRFPRVLTKGASSVAANNLDDPSNWSGFANLTDQQIASLAKSIVEENKARFAIQARTERDLAKAPRARLFGGLAKPATPYLGLSEFINRFLTSETWASRCGALQAAIFRADQTHKAGLSDRLFANADDRKLTQNALTTATAGWFPHPENIEVTAQTGGSRTHTAMGAPGNLLQSDLLQSLGSALTARSDTFTLRCYGEATQDSGEIGSAWMEVVVQRIPEFVDPTNPAETGNSAPRPLKIAPSAATDPTLSTALTPVNNVLGRRFKVVSMRWLKADEI
jgi:hypothetical protein